MKYLEVSPYIFDCGKCPTPCDDKSKRNYIFEKDLALSEYFEDKIREFIASKGVYDAFRSVEKGLPDIEVTQKDGVVKAYVEVKVQQRTFMSVVRNLPSANLLPSETLALNLSDLYRYFKQYEEFQKPIYVVWVLLNRPCIVHANTYKLFAQKIEVLRDIYEKYGIKRRFKRQSSLGDIVEGQHLGVVVNYHFSINELKEWNAVL